MPKPQVVAMKSLETIQSYKSGYMDIFSRCTGNREIGLLANEASGSASNLIRQLSTGNSMNYYLPENNEELLNLVYDITRLEKLYTEATWTRFDVLSSTVAVNLQMGFDIIFSAIIWDEIRKIVRPDITLSIFENTDDETKEMIAAIANSLLPSIKDYIGKGIGSRPLNHGQCSRDCTKCPLAQNFSIDSEDVITFTKARCPIFLGRQSLLVSRIFAQVQVLYRTSFLPVATSIGLRYEIEAKMTDPVKFYLERVNYINYVFNTQFTDIAEEAQANIGFFMSNNISNMNDIIMNYAKGQVPTYVLEWEMK